MRSVTVRDWLLLEQSGLLEDGQIIPSRATEAAVLLLASVRGCAREEVEAMPVHDLWVALKEVLSPFPERNPPA